MDFITVRQHPHFTRARQSLLVTFMLPAQIVTKKHCGNIERHWCMQAHAPTRSFICISLPSLTTATTASLPAQTVTKKHCGNPRARAPLACLLSLRVWGFVAGVIGLMLGL